MKKLFVLVAILLLFATLGLSAPVDQSRRLQTTTRTAAVGNFCAKFSSRTTLVDSKAATDAANIQKAMSSSFKMSGNQLIKTILASPDKLAAVQSQAQPMIPEAVQFVGPFIVGFVIILLIWPFLICCCCCPSCCPSKCCQKPETQQYTKCELIWPSVILVIALVLVIVPSIIGLSRSGDIQSSYEAVGCSAAIAFDDLLNGNVSTAGTFFVGLQPLVTSLGDLKLQLNNVNSQVSDLSYTDNTKILRQAYDEGTALLDELSKVPNGAVGGSITAYSYNNFDGTVGTTPSLFPNLLGAANHAANTRSGAMNVSYTVIDGINEQVLANIGKNVDNFSSQIGTVGSTIDSVVSTVNGTLGTISSFNGMLDSMGTMISPYTSITTTAVTAFFAVFIGLGILGIIGVILMTCCDKYGCRYLLYFVCLILFVLGIISFLLAVIFSIITPVIYLGCDFISVTVSSQANFTTNIQPMLGAQLTGFVSVCLSGGSGDIVSQAGVDTSAINGLSGAMDQMRQFNTTLVQNTVQSSLDGLQTFIDSYYFTDLYDFSSTTNNNFMGKVADPTNAAYSGCTNNGFATDSWIPSIRQSTIGCVVSSNRQVSVTQCGTSAKIAGGQGGVSPNNVCYGCLDSTKILVKDPGTPLTDITARYGNPGAGTPCHNWIQDMTLLYNNYYSVKKTKYGAVETNLNNVYTRYNTATTGYKARIASVGSKITTVIGNLQTLLHSVFDTPYGMIAGLNCLLLGEDINLIANTACTKLFTTFYFLRLTLGIAAFGILFTMCCTVCSGVRSYKHSMRRGTILPNEDSGITFNNPQQSTMAALNQKY